MRYAALPSVLYAEGDLVLSSFELSGSSQPVGEDCQGNFLACGAVDCHHVGGMLVPGSSSSTCRQHGGGR